MAGVDGNGCSSRFHQAPAHLAAYGGQPHVLQWLLQAGACLDTQVGRVSERQRQHACVPFMDDYFRCTVKVESSNQNIISMSVFHLFQMCKLSQRKSIICY